MLFIFGCVNDLFPILFCEMKVEMEMEMCPWFPLCFGHSSCFGGGSPVRHIMRHDTSLGRQDNFRRFSAPHMTRVDALFDT